jgi:hypothetical protein
MEKNFISEEDKVVLRKVAKYLKSYNIRSGVIQVNYDDYDSPSRIMKNLGNFSNHWNVEIPDFFRPYLGEIIEKVILNLDYLDVDSPNYDNVDFEIDTTDSRLYINRYWAYEQPGDSGGLTWGDDTEDTELVQKLLHEIMESGAKPDSIGKLQLDYSGGGDSGYLESSFSDGGGRVPANIEDWCYQVLENNYGGWEINEGSQGYFIFDTKNNNIELEHTNNEVVEESEEILSVYFGKSKD